MTFSLGGSKQKSSQSSTQSYTPNDGFVTGVTGLLNSAQSNTYNPLTQGQIDSFANPYLSQVGDSISSQIGRSKAVEANNLDAQAARAGAFGGTGWGLLRSESARGYDDAEASALANLNATGYQNALSAAQSENQAQNQYGLNNLLAQLQGYGLLNYGTTSSSGTSKGSGLNYGLSYTYGGK